MKNMQKRILSILLILCILLVAAPTRAATGKVTTDTVTNLYDAYNSTSGQWNELITAKHRLSGSVVYCLQHKKQVPNSQTYNLANLMGNYSAKVQKGLQIILENGYPWERGGLSAAQAEYATANAIRFWLSECGDSQFYNQTNLESFSNTQLRNLAVAGLITKKVRVRNTSYIPALQFSAELLIKARAQTLMAHDLTLSAGSVTATLSGTNYVASTAVAVINLRGGYTLDKSALPSGSTVSGYTGGNGDTLVISIPASAATANKSYTLTLTGLDDRVLGNMRVYNHNTNTDYQHVLATYVGASYYAGVVTRTLTVTTGPYIIKPDLVVSALTPGQPSYTTRSGASATATIINQGSAAGGFYVSLNAGSEVQYFYVNSLAAGASATASFNFTAPATAQTLTLTATADYDNWIAESDESNNTRTTTVSIIVPALPDLIVSALTPGQPSYLTGTSATATATITNQGNATANSFYVSLIAGSTTQTFYVSGLAVGASATASFNFTTPAAAQALTLTATADYDNRITESNEANNMRTATVSIVAPALPDLIVSALSPGQPSYLTGSSATATATITNQGNAPAGVFYVSLNGGGRTPGFYISGLAAGASTTASFNFSAPATAQMLTLIATADYDNRVVESDENNNVRTATVSIVVPTFPDLTVISVSPAISSYNAGTTVTIYSVIKNQGNAGSGAFVVKLAPEGMSSQTQTITGLAPGASQTLTWTFTAPTLAATTSRSLTVLADATYAITESNESNNEGTGSVTILREKPDLTITALTVDANSYKPGERVTMTSTVKNNGIIACPASKLRLMGDGMTTQDKDVASLPAGGSQVLSFSFTAPDVIGEKTYAITATADPDSQISESNEGNNSRSTSFVVSNPLPDLTVTQVRSDKNEYDEGETGNVTVTVKNQGAQSVSNAKLKLNLGDFFSQVKQTGAIAVGDTVQVTFSFTAPETLERRTVTATATVDPTDEISESNESNNTLTNTLSVRPILPDLALTSTNATNWYAGKDIVVTATVVNYTASDVPLVTVRLTLGGKRYEEAIPLPGNGTNLAVFRVTLPMTTGPTALNFTIDPYNAIPEQDKENNDLEKTIEIVSVPAGVVLDPDMPSLETNFKQKGLPPLPDTTNSDYHIWQEVRLEGEAYVTKTFWAQLRTVFTLSPDPRIAYEDDPTRMESGFGVQASLQTSLTSNYDHPEKLVGVQMAWIFNPESGYGLIAEWSGAFDTLEVNSGRPGGMDTLWQYAVNPWSDIGSRLHYTPLWFPDGQYTVLSQAFYAWSPAGQMYWYDAGSVDIFGDMYDRVTAIQGR